MFDLLVVATDGSESGERAVATALDLADRFDAAVHVLSVVDPSRVAEVPAEDADSVRAALHERASDAVDAVAEQAPDDIEVDTLVREGHPADAIVDYAQEAGADSVALGTRGRGGDGGFLLGSVAEAVVRTCERPVLTVRGERAGEGAGADG
ncbi:universal stress protein [Haloglomus salinum]|jgi:nucleotide-binding universal stress UspA family protein|uniref:universal stress protein n=1 Tax=Haloglomus salinum TaxID=2962673 RepID=UPI0020CA2448|nr:universal stress protein [Haloglomus salinum]